MQDHGKFFTSTEFRKDNYKAVIGETNYKKAVAAILEPVAKAGYATDPKYASKVISIIEAWDLTDWDNEAIAKPVSKPVDKPKEKTVGVVKMSGTFQAQEEIIVRDKPSTGGRHVATYYAGETLKYDRFHFTNGYTRLEYKRATGGKAYIPIAPVQEVWGSLK